MSQQTTVLSSHTRTPYHRQPCPLIHPLQGLEEVVATQQALDVMLEGQDYAGALDLLEQLRSLLQQPQLMGLQCLRHLPPRLMDMAAAVDGALANEFLTTVANPDVGRIAAEAAADADAHPGARQMKGGGEEHSEAAELVL